MFHSIKNNNNAGVNINLNTGTRSLEKTAEQEQGNLYDSDIQPQKKMTPKMLFKSPENMVDEKIKHSNSVLGPRDCGVAINGTILGNTPDGADTNLFDNNDTNLMQG